MSVLTKHYKNIVEEAVAAGEKGELTQGCNLSLFNFYLGGKRTYWGLPNNPHYEIGALWGSSCDTLTNGVIREIIEKKYFKVYPNPFKYDN